MSFYGDETRWFVGTVKKHDPESIGRLQVRIHGIHGPDVRMMICLMPKF